MAEYKAKALFDYKARVKGEESELDLNAGDVVSVEDSDGAGWVFARLGGKSGWVPSEYVKRIVEDNQKPETRGKAPKSPEKHNKGVDCQKKALEAFNSGKFEEAAENFKLAAELFQDAQNKATMYANQGAALSKLQRNDDACIAYEEALKAKPDHFQSLHNRGVSLRSLERLEYALDAFSEAVKINPKYYASWCGRCDTLIDLKRFEEAVEAANAAIALEPSNSEAYCSRAVSNFNMGNYAEALKDFDKVATFGHNGESKSLHVRTLCKLAQQAGGSEGIVIIDKAIALEGRGGSGRTLRLKGGILANIKDKWEAAATAFRAALKLQPDDVDAKVQLGNLLIKMKDHAGAVQNLEEAVQTGKPNSIMKPADIYLNIGVAHFEAKQFQKAKAALQQALSIDTTHEAAKHGLKVVAQAIKAEASAPKAEASAPKAEASAPTHARINSLQEVKPTKTAAEVYQEQKKTQEAKEAKEAKEEEFEGSYPLSVLQNPNRELQPDIDSAKREKYLSKRAFFQVFNMTRPAFYRMFKWRQQNLKRKSNLW